MKNNKTFLIALGFISLIIFIVIGIMFSYAFSGMQGHSDWLNWQSIVIPMIIWLVVYPLYILYLHFKWKEKKDAKLASSNWMNDMAFNKLMNHHSTDKSKQWQINWLSKTKITRNGALEFASVKSEGHAIIIGSTGSGKTSLLLNPTVQLFARNKDQPTMFFSDPKGELYDTHSDFLNKQGYEVLSINLRDLSLSSTWNPLEKLWDMWFVKDNIEESREKALNYLSELASTLFVPKSKETFWEEGANTIFRFFVLALLERIDENKNIKKEHLNITNIINNIQQTTYDQLQDFLEELPKNSYAMAIAGRNIRGSETTVSGLFQTCITTLQIYNDSIIKRVTSATNLKIHISKPQAIFIVVPDESKAKYPFISLFVSEMYKELIAKASVSPSRTLSRRVYFLLDEFGNIPKIPQMDQMITVSRSRNIFFMLLLQNYSQLNEVYGNNVANTIISNCAYEFFLLTSDIDTAKKFSQKLGERSITQASRSTSSHSKGPSSSVSESERTRNLIHPDELMRLQFGEFILSMQRETPIKSTLDQFWNWKDYTKGPMELKSENVQVGNYNEKFIFDFIKHNDELTSESIFDQLKTLEGGDDESDE